MAELNIKENVRLARLSSWRVGGPAERFVEPKTQDEVVEAQVLAKENGWPVTVIGGGSNTLISDQGIKGLVISTRKLIGVQEAKQDDHFFVTAQAGTPKLLVMKSFLNQNLAPALFLSGIPGDVAGGVVMNAGVSENVEPREFCEIVSSIKIVKDGVTQVMDTSEIGWSYRSSVGWQPGIILEVTMKWPFEPISEMKAIVRAAQEVRAQKQPLEMPSCGSVFVNPESKKAAQLIDSCGLKGFRIGGAEVSKKHANFIVNSGEATAQDIHDVMEHVQREVFKQTGVKLHNEVRYLGTWD